MKKLTFILLLFALKTSAQTHAIVSLDAGTQVTAATDNYSLGMAIGLSNWNGDYASIGVTTKTYKSKTLCAGRITGLLMANKWLALYLAGDVFLIHDKPPIYKMVNGQTVDVQYNNSRLELSTGVGIKGGHLLILTGIQADDFDPIKNNRKQPVLTSRLVYNFNLRK